MQHDAQTVTGISIMTALQVFPFPLTQKQERSFFVVRQDALLMISVLLSVVLFLI